MKPPAPDAAPPQIALSARVRCARVRFPSGREHALAGLVGPALIVVSVLVAMRGFVFANLLTNQHPDILTFWLPRSCLMGRSLASGHVPLWNPFEMIGVPFAADPQSGWLYLPSMLLSWAFGCGGGLRVFIVLQPILAGLGLHWFLRKEGLHRVPATAGGLSIAMMISSSNVGISLPFSGTLAWTPFALVGASGYFSSERWWRRLLWLALAALAWGQVAGAHLSHGLLMCTAVVAAYVVARGVHEVRRDRLRAGKAVAMGLGFLAFLPIANLAVLIPRFALISHSSLRGGYSALGGTLARVAGIEDRPLPTSGVWSGWPFMVAVAPGAYAGAAILLSVPASLRAHAHRYLVAAVGITGIAAYLLTLSLFVGAAWFRNLLLRLPFGDVYLHNPGRLRYLILLLVPLLGAVGIQGFLDQRPSLREGAWWLGGGVLVFLGLPLALGAHPARFLLLGLGILGTAPVLALLFRGRRWASIALVGLLAVELLAGAVWSSAYGGGTLYLGLEGAVHPVVAFQPLRWPDVPLDRYLEPGPIARYLQQQGPNDGRYLAWIQPAAVFNKGYLFTQQPTDWPALLLGRAVLFGLDDALGYSPIQLPRYWSYIRATDRLPVFYNASVLQLPKLEDVRLLGIRYLVVPEGLDLPPGLTGTEVATDHGYALYEIDGWEPRVSVVTDWTVTDGATALRAVLRPGFDPGTRAVVEGEPGIPHPAGYTVPTMATYREIRPEDVRITLDAKAPSLVVVRNAWDRGWSATVDGEPARVLRTDYFLQGVPVEAGSHEVRLTYADPNIGRGLLASALAWLGWLGSLAAALALERRGTPTASDPA